MRHAAPPCPSDSRSSCPAPIARVRRGITPAQAQAAAGLYWQAFGGQMLPLPVRADRGQALLLRRLYPFRALSAEADGRLVGLIGLRDTAGGLFGPTPADIRDIWPGIGGGVLSALSRLHRAGPASAELVIDGIVVAPTWRGQGIGAALVRAAMTEAAARGFPGLRAEVAPRNRAGLALYQSLGFTQIARARMGWPWSGRARIMRLAVPPPPGCPPSPSPAPAG